MDDSHDGFFGLYSLVLVPSYCDGIVVGFSALGKVYLHSKVRADFGDDRASFSNN